ncbi:MAG: HD domain-containing protein [Eubacterium sp.]|nr:HD domain-containing protein [Eubacterium sp.]
MRNYGNEEIRKDILRLGGDIIHSDRFQKAWNVRHHVDYNIAVHSLEVAGYSLIIARWLARHGVHVNEEDVVRAGLLHDIGMTEDNVFTRPSYIKAFTHPVEGRLIAAKEYSANKVQQNAIHRHMWPICMIPPHHIAGWVVMIADKASASREAKEVAKHRAKDRSKAKTDK